METTLTSLVLVLGPPAPLPTIGVSSPLSSSWSRLGGALSGRGGATEPSLEFVLEMRYGLILNSGFVSSESLVWLISLGSRLVSRVARLGADLLLGVLTPVARSDTSPPDMETELGLLGLPGSGSMSLSDKVGNCPVEDTRLAGGQHLEASQPAAVRGPLGQESIQSSVLEIEPVGSAVSTNSGCIVVE